MAKRPKPKRKPAKRVPTGQRLHVPDVQAALDAMWKLQTKKRRP